MSTVPASASASSASSGAAAASNAKAEPQPVCYTAFNKQAKGLLGYDAHRIHNVKHNLKKKEKAVGSKHDFSHFELGRPSVRGDLFAVATDTPEASQHFLAVMNAETMLTTSNEPLVCYASVDEHVSDLHWLTDEVLIGSTGKGNLKLFEFDGQTVKHTGNMPNVCKSYIREIAVQPGSINNIVLGGFDQKLNFLDLNRPDAIFTQRLDMQGIIGSIKWAPFHEGAYVSAALDDGKFYLFDARVRIKEAAFFFDSRKEDMYTHERYNEFGVLLGYGDGELKHIDMRMANKVLHSVQDPYVEAIGNIAFNAEAQAFVVSGFTDFSVWKVNGLEPKLHSHADLGEAPRHGDGLACSAVWYDRKTVLSSDNSGTVGLYLQGFD